jgi:hypothetical protein
MSIFGESCGRLVSLVISSVLLTSVGANGAKRKGECLLQPNRFRHSIIKLYVVTYPHGRLRSNGETGNLN